MDVLGITLDAGLGDDRSDQLVMIHVFTQKGRDHDVKQRLLARRAEKLGLTGVPPEDLLIAITENSAADCSIGFGRVQFLTGEFAVRISRRERGKNSCRKLIRPLALPPQMNDDESITRGDVMETTDLYYFLAVARAKGMTRASEELHTVQSNISSRIRALENEVGVPLFLRHARGVTLTGAGEKFLPYAERVVQLMREGINLIGDLNDPRGRLAIGSMETTAGWRLPELLAAYTADCPEVELLLETGPTDGLVQGVIDYRLDGAFVAGPVAHPELQDDIVFTEELVLVTSRQESSPESALVSGQKVLVFRAGCSYRARLLTLMGSHGVNTPAVMEFGTLEGILGCVAAGMGITLLPRNVVSRWASRDQVAIHRLAEDLALSQTSFVRRTDATLSPAMARFLKQLEVSSKSANMESAAH